MTPSRVHLHFNVPILYREGVIVALICIHCSRTYYAETRKVWTL